MPGFVDAVSEQALVEQRVEQVEVGTGYRLGRVQPAAAGEGKPAGHVAPPGRAGRVTSRSLPECPLPLVEVTVARDERREPLFAQSFPDRLWGERTHLAQQQPDARKPIDRLYRSQQRVRPARTLRRPRTHAPRRGAHCPTAPSKGRHRRARHEGPGVLLVLATTSVGQRSDSRRTNSATASTRCSQLSRTRSACLRVGSGHRLGNLAPRVALLYIERLRERRSPSSEEYGVVRAPSRTTICARPSPSLLSRRLSMSPDSPASG